MSAVAARQTTPWDRRATFALLALVVAALTSLIWLVHPWYEASNDTNDAAIYIACAKSMIEGDGYSYLGEPFTVRPPGFAALIAPLIAWRGLDFLALNLLVSLTGVALVALLFVFARARIGSLLAFFIALAVWLNDGFRTLCCQVMSDVPGAASLVACILVERWAARERSWKREAVLGIAIGASAYVRSIVILLVPATITARILERFAAHKRGGWIRFTFVQLAPMALATFLVQLPWEVRNVLHHPTPPVDQNFLYSYSTAMWHVDGGDPRSPRRSISDIASRIPGRVEKILGVLGRRMRPKPPQEPRAQEQDGEPLDVFHMTLGAVFLACIAALAWSRRFPAEIFALGATAILCIHFSFRERLVLPVWILALPATAECALLVARRVLRERAAIAVSVLLLALPALDFRPRAGWDRIEQTHFAYVQLCSALRGGIPPEARVATWVGWHLSVYLDRPVWSLFFAVHRANNDPSAAEGVFERHAIDVVEFSPMFLADRDMVAWLQAHHGPGRAVGPAIVFDVKH